MNVINNLSIAMNTVIAITISGKLLTMIIFVIMVQP